MKFEKTYKEYMKQFVVEGILGSVAAAIPRTIGKAVGNVVKQAYADNPYVQAFGQVRQAQAGEREAQRTKEGKILNELEKEMMNDPNFIKKRINFTFELSAGTGLLSEQKSYNELSNYPTKERDKVRAIKKVIAEVDLNDPSFNLYNQKVKDSIKEKVNEIIQKTNKEQKQDQGEDYKKVKADTQNILIKIERMINDTLKPLGVNKSIENKVVWLYILAAMTGSTPSIKL